MPSPEITTDDKNDVDGSTQEGDVSHSVNTAGAGDKPQEVIQFYPTFGSVDPQDEQWLIKVGGRVIEPRANTIRRKLLLRVIRQVLNATTHQLNSPIFQDRVSGFLMITRRGRRIRLKIGGLHFRIKKRSNSSGEFSGTISLTPDELRALTGLADLSRNPWVDFRSQATKKIRSSHLGRVQIISPEGCSVITDIDDTIKASNVLDRGELLANTFFEPFEAVDGMADIYQEWAREGVAFHYVSSSPWQLYPALASFMQQSGFPSGTFHLRSIRLRDPSILQLVVGRKSSKKRAIKQILRAFPNRRFVLIGDVGEKDPEIYGSATRKYPSQIDQICLRRLDGGYIDPERFAKAFRKVPVEKWRIFDEAAELENLFPRVVTGWHDQSL